MISKTLGVDAIAVSTPSNQADLIARVTTEIQYIAKTFFRDGGTLELWNTTLETACDEAKEKYQTWTLAKQGNINAIAQIVEESGASVELVRQVLAYEIQQDQLRAGLYESYKVG